MVADAGRDNSEGPEATLSVDLTFHAHDRFIVTTAGRFTIDTIVVTMSCQITVRSPEGEYYEYGGARFSQFSDRPADNTLTTLASFLIL